MKANEPSFASHIYAEEEWLYPKFVDQTRSNLRVSRWKPGDGGQWSELIQRMDQANVAHAPEWFMAIQTAYGHFPLYLYVTDSQDQAAILPSFIVRSRLFGTMVTSMPFLDTGGPCSASAPLARALVDALVEEAKRL